MSKELEILDALCRQKLDAYANHMFDVIEPSTPYLWNWHIGCICDHLEATYRGELKRLIINIPPRTLKTVLVSVMFPSWVLGHDPTQRFITTSFKFELAQDMSYKCRDILQSEKYQRLFPNTRIDPTQSQKHNFQTTDKGHYYSSSMSSVTGRGGGFIICFPKGTYVYTNNGERCISSIRTGEYVWSYNHEKERAELRKVTKIFERTGSRLVEVRTVSGNRILCTPEHPFWVGEQGYKEAKRLGAGDEIIERGIQQDKMFMVYPELRLLWERIQKEASGLFKVSSAFSFWFLLLKQLLKDASQLQKQEKVCSVRGEDREQIKEILQNLQDSVLSCWGKIEVHKAVQIYQAINRIQRQLLLCDLQIKEEDNNTSSRRKPIEQQTGEPDDFVPIMPREAPPKLYRGFIESVTEINTGSLPVYDISVEGNSNFFAEGVLVHNCDDPLNPDEAASEAMRKNVNNTIRGTLFSRFNDPKTGRFILVMQRLHEDDPTGNLLQDEGYTVLKLPAEAPQHTKIVLNDKTWEMEKGELLFPERLDRATLDTKRIELGEYHYTGQYLQDPVPLGGGEFKDEWIQYYQAGGIRPKIMNIYILVDPAGGEEFNKKKKKTSDYSAFMVVGTSTDNNYYLLDVVRDRLNPTERVHKLFELHKKWNALASKPPKVGYEKYGMMTDTHYIKNYQEEIGYRFPMVELGGRMMKEERIRRLIPDLQTGRWWFPANLMYTNCDGVTIDLIRELVYSEMASFPRSRFDDMLDALSRIYEDDLRVIFPAQKTTHAQEIISMGDETNETWMDF